MEYNFQEIDDIFRKKFAELETPPPENVWENVAAVLEKKRSRKPILLWFAGGIFAFMSAGFLWAKFSENSLSASKNFGAKTEILENNISKNANDPTVAFSDNAPEMARVSGNNFAKKSNDFEQNLYKSKSNSILKSSEAAADFYSQNRPQVIDNQLVVNEILPQNIIIKSDKVDRNFVKIGSRGPLFLEYTRTTPLPNFKMKKLKRPLACPTFKQQGKGVLTEFFVGPAMTLKSLSDKNNDSHHYLNRRLATENSRLSWTAGARLGWLLAGKLWLRSGAQFTQIRETFNYYNPSDYLVHYGSQGNVIDTIFGERFINSPIRLNFVDVPLTVGYEFGRGRLGVDIFGGVAANLAFWQHGKMLNQNLESAKIRSNFRGNAGFSLSGGAQVFYQTKKDFRFFAETNYRHFLSDLTKNDYPISQKYGVVSINFGFARLINK